MIALAKVLVGRLIATIVGILLLMGVFAVANAPGTNAKANQPKSRKILTCTSDSAEYAEGTVIQVGNGPEQMCVRSLDARETERSGKPVYGPEWVLTSTTIRERSATVVHIPEGPPIYCSPGPAAEYGRCTCQAEGEFSSGARVNSAKARSNCVATMETGFRQKRQTSSGSERYRLLAFEYYQPASRMAVPALVASRTPTAIPNPTQSRVSHVRLWN
jgi:hypothetical protein